MKKISLLCACTLACLSLAACGNNNTQRRSESAKARSEKIEKVHQRKLAKKRREKKRAVAKAKKKKEEQQAASSSSSQQQGNQQNGQQQSNSPQASSNNGSVNNANQAVAAARAKYGDNNGTVHWTYMIDADTGQPIRNPDGSYFVKGIANNGTMTGTEYSVSVGTDGSISSN